MVASMAKISRPLPSPTVFRLRTSLRKASISARVERSGAISPRAGFAGVFGSAISSHSVRRDRKSVVSGKSVTVRVDLGGRRRIKKKKKIRTQRQDNRDNK